MQRTRYEHLSEEALYAMYRENVFKNLSEDQKLDLLQETVNRDALERGMVEVPKVTLAELPAKETGFYDGTHILMSREMVIDQKQSAHMSHGEKVTWPMEDANLQALATAIHENMHAYEEQVASGKIENVDSELAKEYQANDFTESVVLQNGSYKMGSQYLNGKTSHFCYYFQSTERDAYRESEMKTNRIIQMLTEKYGNEKSFEKYTRDLQVNGYEATEKRAMEMYQNPNFVRDLNQTLKNHFWGTNEEVDTRTEEAVKTEMVATYRGLHPELNTEAKKEEVNVGLDEPTTLEAYNEVQTQKEEMAEVESATVESQEEAECEADDGLDCDDDDLEL